MIKPWEFREKNTYSQVNPEPQHLQADKRARRTGVSTLTSPPRSECTAAGWFFGMVCWGWSPQEVEGSPPVPVLGLLVLWTWWWCWIHWMRRIFDHVWFLLSSLNFEVFSCKVIKCSRGTDSPHSFHSTHAHLLKYNTF